MDNTLGFIGLLYLFGGMNLWVLSIGYKYRGLTVLMTAFEFVSFVAAIS